MQCRRRVASRCNAIAKHVCGLSEINLVIVRSANGCGNVTAKNKTITHALGARTAGLFSLSRARGTLSICARKIPKDEEFSSDAARTTLKIRQRRVTDAATLPRASHAHDRVSSARPRQILFADSEPWEELIGHAQRCSCATKKFSDGAMTNLVATLATLCLS
jgi:hypothetical protein